MNLAKHVTRILDDGAKASREEHPEDAEMRVKGVAEGKAQEAAVLRDYGPLLARLVTVYDDVAAKEALEAFREAFWTNIPARLEP